MIFLREEAGAGLLSKEAAVADIDGAWHGAL